MESRPDVHWDWPEAKNYCPELGEFDPPSRFAKALSETSPIVPGKTRLLDIGCGCGIIGIYCLMEKRAASVTFNDIQSEGIAVAFTNIARQIRAGSLLESQVACFKSDFRVISVNIVYQHDLIVFNAPQIPTMYVDKGYLAEIEGSSSMSYFRLGGPDGLDIVRLFLSWYDNLAADPIGGTTLLSSFLGKCLIEKTLNEHRFKWEISSKRRVDLRPIFHRAVEGMSDVERKDRALEENGNGGWTKELMTVILRK